MSTTNLALQKLARDLNTSNRRDEKKQQNRMEDGCKRSDSD